MSKKPVGTPSARAAASKPTTTYVLFGLDESEQPRGACFTGVDEALLTRLAQALGLRIGIVHGSRFAAILGKLPKGNAHATGKAAVPTIALPLYEQLNALVGGETGVISTSHPKSWAKIEPGQLVIAQDTVEDGWWPAVVVKRRDRSLVLKWRDFPGQGEFIRDVNAVALLNSEQA